MKALPCREDYEEFLREFSQALLEKHRGVCFYVYGSFYDKKEFVSGVSDIDGGIILDSGVITDKKKIFQLAKIFASALGQRNINFNINLLDRETNSDGRFLSYGITMTDYIKRCAEVLSGAAHYVQEMNGLDYRIDDLRYAAYNLRSLRNRLFTSLYDSEVDYNRFVEGVKSNLGKVAKFPKQLVLVQHGELITNKANARARLEQILDHPDLSLVVEINNLLRNPRRLYKELSSRYRAIEWLAKSLEAVEIMIRDYLRVFPNHSGIEVGIADPNKPV